MRALFLPTLTESQRSTPKISRKSVAKGLHLTPGRYNGGVHLDREDENVDYATIGEVVKTAGSASLCHIVYYDDSGFCRPEEAKTVGLVFDDGAAYRVDRALFPELSGISFRVSCG